MIHIRAKAPLRIGFSGGGTDVSPYSDQHGGAVLNATINMYAYCFLSESDDGQISLKSRDYGHDVNYPVAPILPIDGNLDLFKHIYNRLVLEYSPPIKPFRLVTHSDAPYGSGLGGSSTLVVAVLHAMAEWWRLPLGEYDIARLAYRIEREDAQLKGGKQDQYSAAFGGFNYMEFYGDRVIVNPLRIKEKTLNELQGSLLLCFTGRSRESAHIIESQIHNVSTGSSQAIEAMHQVKRDAFEMKEAVLTNRLDRFSEILDRAWKNKKRMSGSISNPEIDALYDYAKAHGATAGKISGAGGGGFIMFSVDPVNKYDLKNALSAIGHQTLDISFTHQGSMAWTA
jgi:D-glycero-alpha-D-manno-heptose-7-phosphate kinase